MTTKPCARCGTIRALEEFSAHKRMRDGRDSWCRPCRAAYARDLHWKRKGLEAPPERQRKASVVIRNEEGNLVEKLCTDCNQMVPASGYSRNRTSSTGFASFCKPCQKAREDVTRHIRTYGISLEEATSLRQQQGNVCAICRRPDPTHIDHDHESGQVRAWLCQRCNMGLGLFGESTYLLRRAVKYLVEHEPPTQVADSAG